MSLHNFEESRHYGQRYRMLREDHYKVNGLFEELEQAEKSPTKEQLVRRGH